MPTSHIASDILPSHGFASRRRRLSTGFELLKPAEEEFGLPSNGPLTLPCDAELIEYVVGLIKQGITRDLEKTLLVFIASSRCSLFSDLHHQVTDHQLPICSF
uniref:Auxin-responsive protein n=1 Tax=Salix viminalis TaxID=40686 RepID=A0A6N2MT61_SALVM